jgi:putative salt-induced outer membrane protein YdiY
MQATRCLTLLFLALALRADQVYLENGDRFSGAIVRMQGDSLSFQSPFAGLIKVPWHAVVAIRADSQLHLILKNGEIRAGTLELDRNRVEVRSGDGLIILRRADIFEVLSDSEYRKGLPEFRPLPRWDEITKVWTATLATGASLTSGNADTSAYTMNLNAVRNTPRNKLTSYFTLVNAGNIATGKRITTANARRGGSRFDWNFNPRQFGFGSFALEFDEFQRLDLRSVFGGGFGHRTIRNERTSLDLLGGAAFNREAFSTGETRLSGELQFTQDLAHKISSILSLQQKLAVFPNLTRPGNFRINFDSSVDTSLWRWLSFQLAVSNRYLTNPVPGRERNDFLLTTGFRISVKP